MAKIAKIQEVAIAELKPYERNAKQHSADQVEKIAASIEEFGFLSPCLIDKDKNIIAGHGRVMAAKKIGLESVPCVFIEGLTEAQRKAYVLADNRITELGGWDVKMVEFELKSLKTEDFDIDLTGFELGLDWFDTRKKNDTDTDGESEEYQDFVEKFEQKKTTDDCYTPDLVYDAVVDWCVNEYGVKKSDIVRPFYPGGDYQNETYPAGCVVIDNPPFSIESEIVRFYGEHDIKFFLFCPALTQFSVAAYETCCSICTGATITYENGAQVNTSFYTNLEKSGIVARAASSLYKAIKAANDETQKGLHQEQRKYEYPIELATAPMLARFSKYGVDYKILKSNAVRVAALDSQKEEGDGIFGGGFLLSEKAAAEKAAAEKAAAEKAAATRWPLSEREKQIIKSLG